MTTIPLLRVVRRLRGLANDWWGIELVFADPSGKLYVGDSPLVLQPICAALHASPGGLGRCVREDRRFAIETAKNPEGVVRSEPCFAGMRRLAVPIHLNGRLQGTVLLGGFLDAFPSAEESGRILVALEKEGLSADVVRSAWAKIQLLEGRDVDYLKGLLKIVIEEIVSYENEISARSRRLFESTSDAASKLDFQGIIGRGAAMAGVLDLLGNIAASESTILITGASGTGKELVAKSIHRNSVRKGKSFVAVNCGAFQDTLLESELFGHVKGSFTGAIKDKVGLLEAADAGTLFLDEVAEMSPTLQVKLLRVLQDGTYYPVGSARARSVNVRVIAATHRPLEEMIAGGRFREDLFYRLNVIRVELPPLRDRIEDLPKLIAHFLDQHAAQKGGVRKHLHPATLERLLAYPWPGNVRELQNEMERGIVLSGVSDVILPAVLSERIRSADKAVAAGALDGRLDAAVASVERELIANGLRRHHWNKSRLARELGVSRTSLLQKIEKYGIERRRKPRSAGR